MLVAVLAAAYYYFATSSISIQSQPTGAEVSVNGQRVGITPLDGYSLSSGRNKIQLTHSHYAPIVEQLDVAMGDHLERNYTLKTGEGTLELLSNPKGAWIDLDGERLDAVTPTTLTVTSGKHRIRMGQDERRDGKKDVVLKHGETLEVNLNLAIDPHGSLTLDLRPRDARVEIIDSNKTYKPGVRLPMGEYAIAVSRRGYISETKRINIEYGDNRERVALARGFGRLNVKTSPADSLIDVTYNNAMSKPYQPNMRLPAGKVTVSVRAMGYRTKTRTIDLKPPGQTLEVRLQKMPAEPGAEITDQLKAGGTGPVMVVMPPGQFNMGNANGGQSEQPVRRVQLTQPFAVSKYEVSVEDFLNYTRQSGEAAPKKLVKILAENQVTAQSPAVYISHQSATKYTQWLSEQTGARYRLPTEAEWEYVARAGSSSAYFFGDDPQQLCQYANVADQTLKKRYRGWDVIDCNDGQERPEKRGQYQPNAFGLHDTHGSVSEWVADCGMPDYAKASRDGTKQGQGMSCSSHGHRGGSWDSGPEDTNNSYRKTATGGNADRGIRLLREL